MHKLLGIMLSLLLVSQPVLANDNARLVGTWRLASFDLEFQSGSPSQPYLGKKWIGYTVFAPDGRTVSVWEAEGREVAKNDEERAALLRTVHAITGTYKYEGGTGVTTIDVASNPAQRGAQVRGYQLEGHRLQVTTPWAPNPNLSGSPVTRSSVKFERVAQ